VRGTFGGIGDNSAAMATTELYCGRCFGYQETVEWRGDILVWIEACDWCLERERERRAMREELAELWGARVCVAAGCNVEFVPRKAGQRFCSDPCRSRERYRLKALARSGNGAAPAARLP
jgi:hypothetical protein